MKYLAQLHVGGLVAVGVDKAGRYFLTVSHSGRGVFDTGSWQRVARDTELAYPINGRAVGIGPLAGHELSVAEIDYSTSTLDAVEVGGHFVVSYAEGIIIIDSLRK